MALPRTRGALTAAGSGEQVVPASAAPQNGFIPLGGFYQHTTGRLVVMAFKLCQEGNRQPLIQQTVFSKRIFDSKWLRMQMRHSFAGKPVGGSSMSLTHT